MNAYDKLYLIILTIKDVHQQLKLWCMEYCYYRKKLNDDQKFNPGIESRLLMSSFIQLYITIIKCIYLIYKFNLNKKTQQNEV